MGAAGGFDPVEVGALASQTPRRDGAEAGEIGDGAAGLRHRSHPIQVDPIERGGVAGHTADEIICVVRRVGEQNVDCAARVGHGHHAVALKEIGIGEVDDT